MWPPPTIEKVSAIRIKREGSANVGAGMTGATGAVEDEVGEIEAGRLGIEKSD